MPKSLFGRSIIILMTPLIVVQVILSYIFFERHTDAILDSLAKGIAGDMQMVCDLVDNNLHVEKIATLAKKNFDFMFYEDVVHTIMAIYDRLTVIPSYEAFAEGAEFAYMDLLWKAADQIDRYVKDQMISTELAQEMYSGLQQVRGQVIRGNIRENRFAKEYMQGYMVERIMQL